MEVVTRRFSPAWTRCNRVAFGGSTAAALGLQSGRPAIWVGVEVMARLRLAAGCGSCSLWGYYRLSRTLRGQVRSTIKSTAG